MEMDSSDDLATAVDRAKAACKRVLETNDQTGMLAWAMVYEVLFHSSTAPSSPRPSSISSPGTDLSSNPDCVDSPPKMDWIRAITISEFQRAIGESKDDVEDPAEAQVDVSSDLHNTNHAVTDTIRKHSGSKKSMDLEIAHIAVKNNKPDIRAGTRERIAPLVDPLTNQHLVGSPVNLHTQPDLSIFARPAPRTPTSHQFENYDSIDEKQVSAGLHLLVQAIEDTEPYLMTRQHIEHQQPT